MSRNKHLILMTIVQWTISPFFVGVPSFAIESGYINIGSGRPVRLHFVMKDANLYSLQFQP
ncbi:MAG: hypothetical protein ACETWQ_21535 [Phycisphaerae bacterium]